MKPIVIIVVITLIVIGIYGLWRISDQSALHSEVVERQSDIDLSEINLEVVESSLPSLELEDAGLAIELDVARNNETAWTIEVTEKDNSEVSEIDSVDSKLSISAEYSDFQAEAFYQSEDYQQASEEALQKLIDRGNEDERFLILSQDGWHADPTEVERIGRLKVLAEESEKYLPMVLGEDIYTQRTEAERSEMQKRADEAEKYLLPSED